VSAQAPPQTLPPAPPEEGYDEQPQNIATAIADISERASVLVREEIELAKAEVTEKILKLARGTAVGVAAGVFLFFALVLALNGCAWLLYYYLPGNDFTYFWGFFAMAAILVFLGLIAGLIAWRVVRRAAPPTPDMAIDEARKIRETVAPPPPPPAGGTAPRPTAASPVSAAGAVPAEGAAPAAPRAEPAAPPAEPPAPPTEPPAPPTSNGADS
jgi:hypothetical protein